MIIAATAGVIAAASDPGWSILIDGDTSLVNVVWLTRRRGDVRATDDPASLVAELSQG